MNNVGEIHNKETDKLMTKIYQKGNDQSSVVLNEYMNNLLDSVSKTDNRFSNKFDIKEMFLSPQQMRDNPLEFLKTANKKYTPTGIISPFNNSSLDKIGLEIKSTQDSVFKKNNLEEVLKEISRREAKVSENFNEQESKAIYGFYATLKSSATYWNNFKENNTGNNSVLLGNKYHVKINGQGWVAIATADAIAFGIGACCFWWCPFWPAIAGSMAAVASTSMGFAIDTDPTLSRLR